MAIKIYCIISKMPFPLTRLQKCPPDILCTGIMKPHVIDSGRLDAFQHRIICKNMNAEWRTGCILFPVCRAFQSGDYHLINRRNSFPFFRNIGLHTKLSCGAIAEFVKINFAIRAFRDKREFNLLSI